MGLVLRYCRRGAHTRNASKEWDCTRNVNLPHAHYTPPQLETCVLKRLLLGCLLNVEPEVASWVEIEAAKNRILGLLLNECIMRSYAEQVRTLVSKNRDSPPI